MPFDGTYGPYRVALSDLCNGIFVRSNFLLEEVKAIDSLLSPVTIPSSLP